MNTDKELSLQALVTGLAAMVPAIFWYAYAVTILWGWFAVPLGVPMIGVAALSFAMWVTLIGLVRPVYPNADNTNRGLLKLVIGGYVMPAVALLVGYAAHSLM